MAETVTENKANKGYTSTFAHEEGFGELVKVEVKDRIAWITMSDPPANTYTYEMNRELDNAILKVRFDENVDVAVLTGDGEKFFSAGANINMLNSVTPEFKYCFCLHANETLSRMEQTPKLFISAINGHCVGGGLEIAMATDIRVARKDAGKMGLPEVNLGVLPGTGGTQRMARIVGKTKAIELMATGRNFSFEEGKELGLVNHIFEGDAAEFREQVEEYAAQFTKPNKATMAVGHIKRSVISGIEIPFESALALERELQSLLFKSQDAKEGIAAYTEKRVPKFEGK